MSNDGSTTDRLGWRCQRALARIEPRVEAVVADHATSFWQRGARRHDLWAAGRVEWTIDNELVLAFVIAESGPAELVVHDFSLIDALRRAIRSRHVRVRYATFRDSALPSGAHVRP